VRELLEHKTNEYNPIHVINTILITMILFLHHPGYTTFYFHYLWDVKIAYIIQKFAVGGFFFFSGLKLSISNSDVSPNVFFKKRFFRIYFLYIASLSIFYIQSFFVHNGESSSNLSNLLMHIFCLQAVFPNLFGKNFDTIWFVSVLMFCYLLFPYIRKYIFSTKKFIFVQLCVFTIIYFSYSLGIKNKISIFIPDFPIYVMFFSVGIIFSRYDINFLRKKIYLPICFIGSCCVLLIYN